MYGSKKPATPTRAVKEEEIKDELERVSSLLSRVGKLPESNLNDIGEQLRSLRNSIAHAAAGKGVRGGASSLAPTESEIPARRERSAVPVRAAVLNALEDLG